MFQKRINFVEESLDIPIIKIQSGCDDDQKDIKFNFCITNTPTIFPLISAPDTY